MEPGLIKLIHVSAVLISITGFFVRGIWMILEHPLWSRKWVKTAPHYVDAVLLISAIALASMMGLNPLQHPWLLAKISALLLYIGLGMVAFRFGRTKRLRIVAWLLALIAFAYMLSVAVSKNPLFFLTGAS